MREHIAVLILGIVFLAMVVSSIFRMNQIRATARQDRPTEPPKATGSSLDPNRYSIYPKIQGGDGAPMVFVAAGTFVRGDRSEKAEYDEKPAREVVLKSYYIDLYEVSNGLYQRFIKATRHRPQNVMIFFDDISLLMNPAQSATGVSWYDADAYCRWSGGRLPTEAEWERAARGEDERQWPWGNEFREAFTNLRGNEDGYQYTAPIGSFEAGRSPYGVYDMAGNLSEWVFDWYDEFYYKEGQITLPKGPDRGEAKVHRGGSWNDPPSAARTTKRGAIAPERSDSIIGFRCAADGS
jgi:formylglycine-generating enzyme required for sulfatase activity